MQKIPFIILNMGKQDLIIRRKFMEFYDIWLDICNQRMVWPKDWSLPQIPIPSPLDIPIATPAPQANPLGYRHELKILWRELNKPAANPRHQADMNWQDHLLEQED